MRVEARQILGRQALALGQRQQFAIERQRLFRHIEGAPGAGQLKEDARIAGVGGLQLPEMLDCAAQISLPPQLQSRVDQLGDNRHIRPASSDSCGLSITRSIAGTHWRGRCCAP